MDTTNPMNSQQGPTTGGAPAHLGLAPMPALLLAELRAAKVERLVRVERRQCQLKRFWDNSPTTGYQEPKLCWAPCRPHKRRRGRRGVPIPLNLP